MRLCKSELSIKFDAKVNNVRGETVDVILTVFNGYDPVKGKYLFSIYLYIQKENGTNEFLCGSISYIDNHENLNIYNTEKGLSFCDLIVSRHKGLNTITIIGSSEIGSVQRSCTTLYFNNNDTMDRCYGAIIECFYDAMNFCSRGKLNVIGES